MKHHAKYQEVFTLVEANIAVLLTGEAGSGKTTLVSQIADDMGQRFFSMSMTRQTTLSHLMGFMSVTGVYVPSLLRDCAENGGLFLLDELDASDPNVVLSLNTVENGYITFPTGIIKLHPEFRLVATANPQDKHEMYTGRAKLDKATLDRFDIIEMDRDKELEKSLVDFDTYTKISVLRTIMAETNSSNVLSMRDSIRFQKRKELNLLDGFVYRLVNKSDLVYDKYKAQIESLPKHSDQSDCKTFDALVDLMTTQSSRSTSIPESFTQEYSNGENNE